MKQPALVGRARVFKGIDVAFCYRLGHRNGQATPMRKGESIVARPGSRVVVLFELGGDSVGRQRHSVVIEAAAGGNAIRRTPGREFCL